MNKASRDQVHAFAEANGMSGEEADELVLLLDDEYDEPAMPIARFVRMSGGSDPLIAELVALYHEIRAGRIGGRYVRQRRIEMGSMGEIWEVFDDVLKRRLAMKILRADQQHRTSFLSRLRLEVRVLVELQHPNLLSVHDAGELDGRPWYIMPLLAGHDFGRAVELAHASLKPGTPRWEPGSEGWPATQRLLSGLLGVCSAVAMAHRRGIVHRDISARNVFVGPNDAHYLLDWGVARWASVDGAPAPSEAAATVEHDALELVGNPVYMAPEQASLHGRDVDERSDVYSLGALLYLLLSNRPPYDGDDREAIIEKVRAGPPEREPGLRWSAGTLGTLSPNQPQSARQSNPPEGLVQICKRAMHRDPSRRHRSATALAEDLQAWLDGAMQRQRAIALHQSARASRNVLEVARSRADRLHRRSQELLASVDSWAPDSERAEGWRIQDEAREQADQVVELELETRRELYTALQLVSSLPQAHEALATSYLAQHRRAEASRDRDAAFRAENAAMVHLDELPPDHAVRREGLAYLVGDGHLSLRTDPDPAEIEVWRYREDQRRLVPERVHEAQPAPLDRLPVQMGSYLLILRAPGCHDVRYPVFVGRQENWSCDAPVWLPPEGTLGEDEVYVAAGWCIVGGDHEQAYDNLPLARVWVDGFVMQRTPVTTGQYAAFLDACSPEEREAYVPRMRSEAGAPPGEPLLDRDGDRFVLQYGGQAIDPRLPVTNVDWHSARAYLSWKASEDKPWRLPGDLEWEKAARGADGRIHPWGDHRESSRCCMFDSHPGGRKALVPVDEPRFWDSDASPWGVRGLAGNVRDWCLDAGGSHDPETGRAHPPIPAEERAIVRGGAWSIGGGAARATSRSFEPLGERFDYIGFRGVYSLPSPTSHPGQNQKKGGAR